MCSLREDAKKSRAEVRSPGSQSSVLLFSLTFSFLHILQDNIFMFIRCFRKYVLLILLFSFVVINFLYLTLSDSRKCDIGRIVKRSALGKL